MWGLPEARHCWLEGASNSTRSFLFLLLEVEQKGPAADLAFVPSRLQESTVPERPPLWVWGWQAGAQVISGTCPFLSFLHGTPFIGFSLWFNFLVIDEFKFALHTQGN